jgi:hypothetical protein
VGKRFDQVSESGRLFCRLLQPTQKAKPRHGGLYEQLPGTLAITDPPMPSLIRNPAIGAGLDFRTRYNPVALEIEALGNNQKLTGEAQQRSGCRPAARIMFKKLLSHFDEGAVAMPCENTRIRVKGLEHRRISGGTVEIRLYWRDKLCGVHSVQHIE